MNTCDTCTYWVVERSFVAEGGDDMVCQNKDKIYCDVKPGADTCGCIAYPDHHSGCMVTGPKFGCVHHRSK